MSSRKWLRREIPGWVHDDIITQAEGKEILKRYHDEPQPFLEMFVILTALTLTGGLLCLGASFWNRLTQDERLIAAVVPLVLSAAFLAIVVLLDRVEEVPVESEEKTKSEDSLVAALYPEREAEREKEPRPVTMEVRHRVPVYVREMACAFHGGLLLLAVWLMNDTFLIVDSMPLLAAVTSGILLLLMYAFMSASFGVFYVVSATAISLSAPFTGWGETLSWAAMAAAIPLLLAMLRNGRQHALIVLSWVWTAGILLLISKTTNVLWEMMFFSEAAAFAWLAGSLMRSYTMAGTAVRGLGSTAMFVVLMISSLGSVWAGHLEMPGGWLLWGFFGLLLLLVTYFSFRAARRKEWLAALGGLVPWGMLGAAVLDMWDVSGASSALLASVLMAVLSLAVMVRGAETGRNWQSMTGFALLCLAGMIRLLDSTLNMAQRGIYFLLAGVLLLLICAFLYRPKAKTGKKKTRRQKEKARLARASRNVSWRVEKPEKVNRADRLEDIPLPKPPEVPVFHPPAMKKGDRQDEQKK
jgi:cbb3-type cytochrome oxidase subunit 3